MGYERDDEAGISKSIVHPRGTDGNHAKLDYLQVHMPQVQTPCLEATQEFITGRFLVERSQALRGDELCPLCSIYHVLLQLSEYIESRYELPLPHLTRSARLE